MTVDRTRRKTGVPRRSVAERFWPKVDQRGPDECWEWQASRDHRGYGRLQSPGKDNGVLKAHRVSYELHNGPIPDGLGVLHRCDNPPCVNPAHLYAGNQAQNADDASRRGRSGVLKWTDEEVRAIRMAVRDGASIMAAAKRFGISESQAHNLVKGAQRRYAGGPIQLRVRHTRPGEPEEQSCVFVEFDGDRGLFTVRNGPRFVLDRTELESFLGRVA